MIVNNEINSIPEARKSVIGAVPYHAPTLTRLGPIHELVLHGAGEGPDMGETDASALS